MTIQDCYKNLGENYDAVLSRIPSESLLIKLCKKFLEDGSFGSLNEALSKNDLASAFAAAHTLKGVALNLNFSELAKAASELTEELRAKKEIDYTELFNKTKTAYDKVISCLKEL